MLLVQFEKNCHEYTNEARIIEKNENLPDQWRYQYIANLLQVGKVQNAECKY